MARLKAYTEKFGLITSKEIRDDDHLQEAMTELCLYTKINKVYLSNGKNSREIVFTYTPPEARPIYYTRSDGIKVFTLSVHPENYPMIAHYANGSTKIIF